MKIVKIDGVNFNSKTQKLVTFKTSVNNEIQKNNYVSPSLQNWQANTINKISPIAFMGKKKEDAIPVLIFMGPPLVGKGTQAKMISEKYNYPQIGAGTMLRQEVAQGTEIGKIVKEYMDKGEMAPSNIVTGLILNRIKQDDCKNGFILDGFPREVEEAEDLLEFFENQKEQGKIYQPKVINIWAPDDVLLQRVIERGKISHRSDDTPEVAKNRLKVYYSETKPVEKMFKEKGFLTNINTYPKNQKGLSIQEVFDRVVDIVEEDD